jgi:nucleotide-binding universal stress UspA family protein
MITVADPSGSAPEIHGPIRPPSKRLRKFMVVVDGSPESKIAIRFAAARAAHVTGGELVLFHCIRPGEFQHWMAVADRMREEAYDEATALMDEVAERLHAYCGVTPEIFIAEGEPKEEIRKFIEAQKDIFGLVLGVGSEGGPGPLIDYFTHDLASNLPCPLFLIPGNMTYEQIDAMA